MLVGLRRLALARLCFFTWSLRIFSTRCSLHVWGRLHTEDGGYSGGVFCSFKDGAFALMAPLGLLWLCMALLWPGRGLVVALLWPCGGLAVALLCLVVA